MRRGLFAIALIVGCNGSPSEPEAPSARVAQRASAAPATTATLVRPSVTWPPPSSIDARAVASLGDRAARAADAPVPVLAPTEPLDGSTFVVGPEFYTLTGRASGATISIQGTRAAHRYEGLAPIAGDHTIRQARGFVTANEGIRQATWLENGAAYSVDVECERGDDARCASDAYVVSFAAALAYAGGRGR